MKKGVEGLSPSLFGRLIAQPNLQELLIAFRFIQPTLGNRNSPLPFYSSSSPILRRWSLLAVSRWRWVQPLHEAILYCESEKVVASGGVVAGVVTLRIFFRRAVELFELLNVRMERIESEKTLFVQIVDKDPVESWTVMTGLYYIIRGIAQQNHQLLAFRFCKSPYLVYDIHARPQCARLH